MAGKKDIYYTHELILCENGWHNRNIKRQDGSVLQTITSQDEAISYCDADIMCMVLNGELNDLNRTIDEQQSQINKLSETIADYQDTVAKQAKHIKELQDLLSSADNRLEYMQVLLIESERAETTADSVNEAYAARIDSDTVITPPFIEGEMERLRSELLNDRVHIFRGKGHSAHAYPVIERTGNFVHYLNILGKRATAHVSKTKAA